MRRWSGMTAAPTGTGTFVEKVTKMKDGDNFVGVREFGGFGKNR
jgi:hypothetical protein